MEKIPLDIWYKIFDNLDDAGVAAMALVCKSMLERVNHARWRGYDYTKSPTTTVNLTIDLETVVECAHQLSQSLLLTQQPEEDEEHSHALRLYSIPEGQREQSLTNHPAKMSTFTRLNRDTLVVGYDDGHIDLFNIEKPLDKEQDRQPIHTLTAQHTHPITALAKIDQDHLVTGDASGKICIWEVSTHTCLHSLELNENINAIRSTDPNTLKVMTKARAGFQAYHLSWSQNAALTAQKGQTYKSSLLLGRGQFHRGILQPSGRFCLFQSEHIGEETYYLNTYTIEQRVNKGDQRHKDYDSDFKSLEYHGRPDDDDYYTWDSTCKISVSDKGRVTFYNAQNNQVCLMQHPRLPLTLSDDAVIMGRDKKKK